MSAKHHHSRYAAKIARRKKGGLINFSGTWPFNNPTWLEKFNFTFSNGQQQKAGFTRLRRGDEAVAGL